MPHSKSGTSLIDLIISLGIIAVLFGGIYLVYFSILTAVNNINVRSAATTALSDEFETIRNLPYDNVGTVGGVPAGVIPQTQNVTVGNYTFLLQTTIRNIDDPFDGTLGGNPNDTAPADYKLVSIGATCALCNDALDVEITGTVAPKNLESATTDGSLFIYAVDDTDGSFISGATVHVVDSSVTPSINLTDTTNASGVLELVGVPTSTQSYQVTVTKAGYSTAQTYPPGGVGNPNPTQPNLTAAAQTVTPATFLIDRLSPLTVITSNDQCVAVDNEPFSIVGSKLIGTPDVVKFSSSSITNASGTVTIPNLEGDTYTLTLTDPTEDVVGTLPLDPLAVNASSSGSFRFILTTAAHPALQVAVIDSATGAGIPGAMVTITKGAVAQSLVTDQATLSQTDWSGAGQAGYASQSGGIDATSLPGVITLLANASGTYATGTTAWLVSNTFDVGGTNSNFYNLSWNPASQPVPTGVGSLMVQIAGNDDNVTWNFIGPDGTSASYFTASGTLPAALSGDRYIRYKVYLTTANSNYTPELDSLALTFSADCVPPAQVLFQSVPTGSYTLDATAANYAENSTTVAVGAGFQSSIVSLVHL